VHVCVCVCVCVYACVYVLMSMCVCVCVMCTETLRVQSLLHTLEVRRALVNVPIRCVCVWVGVWVC
jgi:hypothetical protein